MTESNEINDEHLTEVRRDPVEALVGAEEPSEKIQVLAKMFDIPADRLAIIAGYLGAQVAVDATMNVLEHLTQLLIQRVDPRDAMEQTLRTKVAQHQRTREQFAMMLGMEALTAKLERGELFT